MEGSGLNQWTIGEVKITRVVESQGPRDGTFILPNGTAENIKKESDWLYPAFSDENGQLRLAIQALVIESKGKRIIVDTCIGNEKVRSNPEWNKLVPLGRTTPNSREHSTPINSERGTARQKHCA